MARFGLIGEHLGHSFSPQLHAMIGDYEYRLYPMPREALGDFMRQNNLDGFNVTIPYKQDVLPYMSEITARAKAIGAVNTVLRRPDGGYLGDNTDYDGFDMLLGADGHALSGGKAIVLGSGGASKTIQAVLRDAGFAPVIVVSRSGPNHYGNLQQHQDAVLVVNATPVGMYPENGAAPVDLTQFPNCRLVLDAIYNPLKTALLLQAEDLGIPCRNGLMMLSAQAVVAAERFLGRKLPAQLPEQLTANLTRQARSIALIGMPGAGKTTVGRRLGEITGRKFVDMDEAIVQSIGMSIPEYFRLYGEAAFREVETSVLRTVSREPGIILATGGGVVTVPENRNLLRQNSAILLLERNLADLPTCGRPVSQAKGLKTLYEERKTLYNTWCDQKYDHKDLSVTTQRIKEDWL